MMSNVKYCCQNKMADLCIVIWNNNKKKIHCINKYYQYVSGSKVLQNGITWSFFSLLHSGHDGGGGQRQEEPWWVCHGSGRGSWWLCLSGWVCVWRLGSHRWRQTGTVLNAATHTHTPHHTEKTALLWTGSPWFQLFIASMGEHLNLCDRFFFLNK